MGGFRSQGWLGTLGVVVGAVVMAVLLAASPTFATMRLQELGVGRLELSGNVQTQNIMRHQDLDVMHFVQQRNSFRARVDWEFIRGGRLFDKFQFPGIRKANLLSLYRFSYDSIYDYTPNFSEDFDARGTDLEAAFAREGIPRKFLKLSSLSRDELDSYKFDNQLREIYVDLKLRSAPLSLRLGRQQVVWGETDNFRMLDRVNPLDVSWHMVQELPPPAFGWDELRRPLWMMKGLYDLGNLGPISQSFVEFYWNPGDWQPAKVAFLPRPWSVKLLDPLTNPWDGAFNSALCNAAPDKRFTELMNGTRLFKEGDYDHFDPLDNSQVGVRFHGYTPQGLEFTLNFLHQRWAGDDGTNSAPIRGLRVFNVDDVANDPASVRSSRLLEQGIFPAEYITPYVNTVGLSANYSDEAHTQAVFRMETIMDMGIPFFDRGKLTTADDFLPGITEKNMWKGMIGFDRPTWIRLLNNKTTVFLTGQWFWHYLIDNPNCPDDLDNPGALQKFIREGRSCLTGGLDLPSERRLRRDSYRDKIRDWETLVTFAGFTFYRGGSVVPAVGVALDPVNRFSNEVFWTVDYFVTPSFALNLAQRMFFAPTGERANFETWGLNSFSRGRSETAFRMTYNF